MVSDSIKQRTVARILRYLNAVEVRCTYKAVGELLQIHPLKVSDFLGDRRPVASWIVNTKTRLPTEYEKHQLHPKLKRTYDVITSGKELHDKMSQRSPSEFTQFAKYWYREFIWWPRK